MSALPAFTPTDRATVFSTLWTAMWNGELPAAKIVSPDCAVYFGRTPVVERPTVTHGPDALQRVVDEIRGRLPGARYGFDSQPLHHAEGADGGVITLLWFIDIPGRGDRSGIDLLRYRDRAITEVWTLTGDLKLPHMPLSRG